jgi:hypothetical protein
MHGLLLAMLSYFKVDAVQFDAPNPKPLGYHLEIAGDNYQLDLYSTNTTIGFIVPKGGMVSIRAASIYANNVEAWTPPLVIDTTK